MKKASLLLLLPLFLAAPAVASDSPLGVPDAFDPASGRRPAVGEWLEYLVAYQADPLENRLGRDPVPTPRAEAVDHQAAPLPAPISEPEPVWRVLPLRLEIREARDDGFQAVMRFENLVQDLFIPTPGDAAKADFLYEAPQPEDRMAFHTIGTRQVEVTVTRRHGQGYGFARWSHPDLPFGIARFATENVDLVLVGMGTETPPAFPLPAAVDGVVPPPGQLYGSDP